MHISLGHKKQSENQIERFEDALTSAFFGTLRYLPPRLVIELIISALGVEQTLENELHKFCSDDVSVEMEFWPNIAKSGRVEPDLKIKITHALYSSTLDLLIECKWKSGESSDCQLWGQWETLPSTDRLKTYHIYLVKDLHEGKRVRDKNIESASELSGWDNRLFVISWLDLLKAIPRLPTSVVDNQASRAVMHWKKDMAAMFNRIGVHEFAGFKGISERFDATEGKVFWISPFHGFKQLINICSHSVPSSTVKSVVFFK